MKRFTVLLLVLLAAAGLTQTLAQGTKYKVYAGLSFIAPTGDDEVDIDGTLDTLEASAELGYTVGFEYRFTKLFGLDLDLASGKHDVEFGGEVIGETTMTPISASLNFHLFRSRYFDLYLGPTATWVMWDDIDLTDEAALLLGESSVKTDDEFSWGAQVGVDISLVKIVALVIKVSYMNLDIKPEGGDALAVNPLFADVAIAIRWGSR